MLQRTELLSLLFIEGTDSVKPHMRSIYNAREMADRGIGHMEFVTSCERALEEIASNQPNLIFLDENVSDADEAQTIDTAKQLLEAAPDVIILLMGRNLTEVFVMNAMKVGVKGFLVKPFSSLTIDRYIKRFFHQQKEAENTQTAESETTESTTATQGA